MGRSYRIASDYDENLVVASRWLALIVTISSLRTFTLEHDVQN
jgi:hypothetical protein